MKKVFATIGIIAMAGWGMPALANITEMTPSPDHINVAEAKLTVITSKGEKVFTNNESILINGLLSNHNIKGTFKYDDGTAVEPDDIVSPTESKTIYSNSLKGDSGSIKLELPVKTVETDELFVDEERVVAEGAAGEAIKTTITTEIPIAKGETQIIKEDSITILKAPVQRVVEKGTKARPVEEVSSPEATYIEEGYKGYKEESPTVNPPAPSTASSSIVETARQYLGVPYVYGGSSPSGFDCSGLTSYVYGLHGIYLPRTSYSQASAGTSVALANALPGDLLILNGGGHVGIYIGDGQLIHAPVPGRTVEVSQLSYFDITSIRRL